MQGLDLCLLHSQANFFTAEPTEKFTNAYILYVNVHGDVHSEILKENLFRMRSHNEIESFKN